MDVLHLIGRECRRRGYSPRTISTYRCCVRRFFRHCWKEPRRVTRKDIQEYIDYLADRGCIWIHCECLCECTEIPHGRDTVQKDIAEDKVFQSPKKAAVVLSKEEVARLMDAIENPKHKLMIELMYSAGLRVSELCRLRFENLELERGIGWVRRGKGSKDRMFIIARKIPPELMEDSGREWIFEGRKGRHVDIRTLQEIVKKAVKKAGLRKKDTHCHTLRHSFTTHLIEDGYDILTVQQLLGHADIRTTTVYVHVAAPRIIDVKSPYDSLQLNYPDCNK